MIMYALLEGRYPFDSENKTRVMKVRIPKVHGATCTEFTRNLLEKAEEARLTSSQAMVHAFT